MRDIKLGDIQASRARPVDAGCKSRKKVVETRGRTLRVTADDDDDRDHETQRYVGPGARPPAGMHLEEQQADTSVSSFLAELRNEVTEERQALEALPDRLQIDQSRTRKALAWLAEKGAQLTL